MLILAERERNGVSFLSRIRDARSLLLASPCWCEVIDDDNINKDALDHAFADFEGTCFLLLGVEAGLVGR